MSWVSLNFLNYSVKQKHNIFLHMNVRSLNKNINKIDELLGLLSCSSEVMVISETKLKNINYNITSIENYHFHSSYSPTNSGGIGIYLKTPLIYKIHSDLCLNEDLVEDIWVEIKSNKCNKAYVVGGFTSILIHQYLTFNLN